MLAMLLSAAQQTFAAVGGRSDNEPLQLKRERSQPTTVHHRAMASSVLLRHGLKNPCFYGAVPV
jgi:hypothetical protein